MILTFLLFYLKLQVSTKLNFFNSNSFNWPLFWITVCVCTCGLWLLTKGDLSAQLIDNNKQEINKQRNKQTNKHKHNKTKTQNVVVCSTHTHARTHARTGVCSLMYGGGSGTHLIRQRRRWSSLTGNYLCYLMSRRYSCYWKFFMPSKKQSPLSKSSQQRGRSRGLAAHYVSSAHQTRGGW